MLVPANALQRYNRRNVYPSALSVAGAAGALAAIGARRMGYGAAKAVAPSATTAVAYRKKKRAGTAVKYDNNALKRNASKKSRAKPKRQASVRKEVKQVKRSLRTVNKKLNAGMGHLTFRQRSTGRVLAAVNQQTLLNIGAVHLNFIESVLAQLRYYNPSSPATLVTADGTTGSYSKNFLFKSIVIKLTIRNNYQAPALVRTYTCLPKGDTNVDPATAFTAGLADVGNPTSSLQIVYLTDSPQFKDLWKSVKSTKNLLMPGDEIDVYYKCPQFNYDPSYADSNTDTYQSVFKSVALLIRVDGILGHDTSVDEQGFLQAGIDYSMDRVATVDYQAGADIDFIYCTDGSDSFTNGGVVSQKPVADNLPYSVA